jgi:cell division transport system permease protein
MGKLFYFLNETFRGFLHAKLMTFVSIITIAITLFFLGCVGIAFLNIRLWLSQASRQSGVVVYLTDSTAADEAQCAKILETISSLPAVDSADLIDKDEAWQRFETMYGAEMLAAVDENPLPAAVEITLKPDHLSATMIDTLRSELDRFTGIEGIHYSREWLSALKNLHDFFVWSVLIIVPVLLLALHFMIANTVKLTIYARKDLIANMYFVGATDLYIKTPFVMEGILQGLIGGILAVTGLAMVKLFLYRFSLSGGEWYFSPLIFFVGILFGWIGSITAVRRFLV